MLREVRVPKVQTLFVFKLLSQLSRLPRTGKKFVIRRNHDHRSLDLPDVKNSRKWKRMAAISVLPPIHLQPGVIDSHPEVAGVVVSPEHVVNVEDDWLPGHVQYGGFLYLLGWEYGTLLFSYQEKQSSQRESPCSAGEQNGSLQEPFIILYQVNPALLGYSLL